ncbi:LmeA family phospholipid-binding protein [Nocardia tengchongensis]|uniref:LmeA family phospholipid-binding protein n=1 Tax=Nocardia tengchongensis TaxID=2055889 RepID=UPI0036A24BBB
MRALLILLVVVAIALIAGDRVAVGMAQNEIARQIAADYKLPHQPAVTIDGFPFLTQAVDGTYQNIDIRIGEWTDADISVNDLDVKLTGVSAPLGDVVNKRTTNLTADTAIATARVPFGTVQRYAPAGVESISDSPEGLRVAGTFPVAGIPVPATVFVTVAPTDDGIVVTPVSVQAAAGGPTVSLAAVSESLTFTIPLEKLPLGARVTSIQPAANGLHVTAEAHAVRFSDLA